MRTFIIWLLSLSLAVAADPVYWFVRTGQSLSVGSVGYCSTGGAPTCASGVTYGNLTIFTPNQMYPPADTQFRTLAGHVFQNSPPAIESSATSMCNQYASVSGRICATSDYGWPGVGISSLLKGASCSSPNCYYDNSIGNGSAPANTGVIQAAALAAAQSSAFFAPGVYFNQGESEMNSSKTAAQYAANMVTMQSDYNTDINAAISQSGLIPMFIVQKSSWAAWTGGTPRATPTNTSGVDGVPIGQLQACLDGYSTGKIFCVGPDYALAYGLDGVHKNALNYRAEGYRTGKIIEQVTRLGHPARPFAPRSIPITGSFVDVQFWTPSGTAIQLDTTNIAALPDGNYGFELTDTGGSGRTISSVALKEGTTDTVRITLSGAPASTIELRYGYTSPNGACPSSCSTTGDQYSGPTNGPRGNVVDSASTSGSWDGGSLRNHALHFRLTGISAASPYTWEPADPNLSTIPGVLAPALAVSPSTRTYTYTTGASAPAAQSVAISNSGGLYLTQWSATKTQDWLSLSAASGTADASIDVTVDPTGLSAGEHTDTITVTSSTPGITGSPKTVAVTFTVFGAPEITTTSLPSTPVLSAYSQNVVVTGGQTPYGCSITVGALPTGLNITNYASGCTISGTPTVVGLSSFTVRVIDAGGVPVTQPLSIAVLAIPSGSSRSATRRSIIIR